MSDLAPTATHSTPSSHADQATDIPRSRMEAGRQALQAGRAQRSPLGRLIERVLDLLATARRRIVGRGGVLIADHIKPRREGGADELWNLRTLCSFCDGRRHGRRPCLRVGRWAAEGG